MTTRIWDRILGATIAACLLALTVAYLTGTAETFADVGVAAIAVVLVVGSIWACACEPLGEPDTDEPADEVLAIADACACEHPDPLDTTVPAAVAFADRLALLDAEVEAVLAPWLKRELAHHKRWER